MYIPPWTETTVEPFALQKLPKVGDMVTIVPFVTDAPTFELEVTDVLEAMGCTDEAAGWHPVLSPVERSDIRDYEVDDPGRNPEFPFEVGVFYPKIPRANFVPRQSLRLDQIPEGVARHTVQGAVDFDPEAGGGPDVVFVERCCTSPEKALDQCEYICGETYWREEKIWRLYDSFTPC